MQKWRDSFRELKNVRSLTTISLLLAISVALGFYSVQVSDFIRLGFSYLPHELASLYFGPSVGALFGGLMDVLKFIIKPTGPFFPGFTISAIVNGVIYGVVMYGKPVSPARVAVANVLSAVIVNLGLNTYWLTLLYGNAFMAILPARALQQLITCPIYSILFYLVAKVLARGQVVRSV